MKADPISPTPPRPPTQFWTITGEDFARSIKAARTQPNVVLEKIRAGARAAIERNRMTRVEKNRVDGADETGTVVRQ